MMARTGHVALGILLALLCLGADFAIAQEQAGEKKEVVAAEQDDQSKIKVLIVDGQNNHGAWPKTTIMMK